MNFAISSVFVPAAKARDSARAELIKERESKLFEEKRNNEKKRLEEVIEEKTRILELNKRNKSKENIILNRTALLEKAVSALEKFENEQPVQETLSDPKKEQFDREIKTLKDEVIVCLFCIHIVSIMHSLHVTAT